MAKTAALSIRHLILVVRTDTRNDSAPLVHCTSCTLRITTTKGVFPWMKTRSDRMAVLMFIVPGAIGQVSTNFLFRYRFPLLNDSLRCDLAPLYAWWAAQLEAKTNLPPTGREGVGETNDATIDRPMAPWFHITGEILNKDEPQGWIVNAIVETAPGKGTPMRIILIHPPRKEPGRFAERMTSFE